MTNVIFREKFAQMVEQKQKQSRDNLDLLFAALDELDRPASSIEIEDYVRKTAIQRANEDTKYTYESGEISSNEIKGYAYKKTHNVSLRTIQRMLAYCMSKGFIEKRKNKYLLSIMGKRELKFRQFVQAYGITSLNAIMDLNFPTLNIFDKNLYKLVEIFGVYVVYALIEATRLIMANKNSNEEHWHSSFFGDASNFKDGRFRGAKLVQSWIKDVFNPWHMLNIFLTAVSNSDERKGSEDNTEKEKSLIEQRIRQYQHLPQIVNVDSIHNMHERTKKVPTYSTLDMMFRRISEMSGNSTSKTYKDADIISKHFHHIKIRSPYGGDTLLYELESERIEKLKNCLKKQYPSYCEYLQKIDESFYSR